jgi:hypothetical protein
MHLRHIAVCIAALAAGACHRGPSHDGLLLGLTSGRTLLVAWPNDSARLVADMPYLLVPRDDGFWWVGVADRCTIGEGGGGWVKDTLFLYKEEAVFVTRAGEDARVTLEGTTCQAAARELLAKGPRLDPDAVPVDLAASDDSLYLENLFCERDTRQITFVSSTAMSVAERTASTEFCSPAKYSTSGRNVVTRFATSERVPLRPLLGPERFAELERIFSDSEGCAYPSEDPGATVDSTWSIGRWEGAWVVRTWAEGPVVCRGGSENEGPGDTLPRSFTGDAPLPLPWSEVAKLGVNTQDAAASPSGEYVVVQKSDSVLLMRWDGKQLSAPILRVHVGYYEGFTMIRWATPDETRRWSDTLPTLQPPRIVVLPPGGRTP